MAKEDWPESRERLLQDIEDFARKPDVVVEPPPAPVRRVVAASVPPAAPAAAKPAPTPSTPSSPPSQVLPPSGPPSSLLDNLKQQAMVKLQSEEQKSTKQTELLQRMSQALERAFLYLNDLTRQLNVLKPQYAKAYQFFGIVDFDKMTWQEGRADYRMQVVSTDDRYYEQVTLRYRLLGEKPFVVTREHPAQEKLRKALFDNNIAFTAEEERNDRSLVERATFTFPCEIKAGLLLSANYETGKLSLKTRNIERFGIMEFQMSPEDIDATALDELTRFLLGESNRINLLFQRIS